MKKIFDKELKRKVVELSYKRGNVKETAEELGINAKLLYRWRNEYKSDENKSSTQDCCSYDALDLKRENERLQKKIKMAKQEQEELKKAISVLIVKHGKSLNT